MRLLILFIFFLLPTLGLARPEFAVRHAVVSCSACHVSPAGGNIRNLDGKLYLPSRYGYQWTPKKVQEYASLNMRMLYFKPEIKEGSRSGLGLMSATGSLVIPLEEESGVKNLTAAIAYDFGAFTTGKREVFLIWHEKKNQLVQSVLLGKINIPFGLLTDEHRTYTKIQSKTTNNNFEMAAMISGSLFEQSHYDLAYISGLQGGGALASEELNGVVANLRWGPARMPFFLGTSGSYHSINGAKDPYASSLYFALSFDRMTHSSFKGSLLLESVIAKHYNDPSTGSAVTSTFIGSLNSLKTETLNSESQGYYALLNFDVSTYWTIQYKYDRFTLDRSFDGDSFNRHGLGFRYQLSRQVSIMTRYEVAELGRSDIPKTVPAAQNNFYAILNATW